MLKDPYFKKYHELYQFEMQDKLLYSYSYLNFE